MKNWNFFVELQKSSRKNKQPGLLLLVQTYFQKREQKKGEDFTNFGKLRAE